MSKQTIGGLPLELLRRVSDPYAPKGQELARAELRALLDAPDVSVRDNCGVQMVDCPECSHQWDHFFECGNKPAAQPHGEPESDQCTACEGTGHAHINGMPVPGTCDNCKGTGHEKAV